MRGATAAPASPSLLNEPSARLPSRFLLTIATMSCRLNSVEDQSLLKNLIKLKTFFILMLIFLNYEQRQNSALHRGAIAELERLGDRRPDGV